MSTISQQVTPPQDPHANDKLLTAINDAIASDDYATVYEKWFGTAPTQ